jgi:hypothetical protein
MRDPLMARPETRIRIDSVVGCDTQKVNNERRPR